MGIKSTSNISRESAIDRIKTIDYLILHRKYRELESISNERGHSIREYVESRRTELLGYETDISEWTDYMLEENMDEPYYRHSMFDNYLIV